MAAVPPSWDAKKDDALAKLQRRIICLGSISTIPKV